MSNRDIENITGIGHGNISRVTRSIARHPADAVQLKMPRKSKHWRTSRSAARKTMEEHLGRSLRSDEHVHHKDEDYTNNDIDNLEILSPSEHQRLHHPRNPIPRHLRPERRKYMRKYLREYYRRNNP